MQKILISLLLLFFLFSCQKDNRNDDLQEKKIEIKEIESSNIISKEPIIENNSIETFLDIETLYPGKTAVEKLDSNLDLDTAVEQFIILIDQLNLVTIVVADFNKITREYFVAWEQSLPIIYNSDFSIKEEDVLAIKHNLELVVTGTTINNNNSLYIFQKTAPPKGIYIYYKTIFSNESSGTVELVIKTRSLDYTENIKDTDKAYDVQIENTNFLNDNTVAITKESWVWDRRNNIYIKDSSVTTEEKINVKEKLRNVFTGDKYSFLNFIDGEWFFEGETTQDNKIMIIDSLKDRIYFKYNDGIEEYLIKSFWLGFQKITINLENIDVSTIPYKIVVNLESTDSFNVTTQQTVPLWDGVYTRLNYDVKKRLVSETNTEIKKEVFFTGIYKNVAYSLNFQYPNYTKADNMGIIFEEGIFSLISIDSKRLVLQLKANTDLRSKHIITNYSFNYTEQTLDTQAIRTITLHEGVLTAYGIETRPDIGSMKFEQTEVISNE